VKRKEKSCLFCPLYTVKEHKNFIDDEVQMWLDAKSKLDDIYLEKENYWQVRSKEQWLRAGDQNSAYFLRITSNRGKN
jgi:hypothetical protein